MRTAGRRSTMSNRATALFLLVVFAFACASAWCFEHDHIAFAILLCVTALYLLMGLVAAQKPS